MPTNTSQGEPFVNRFEMAIMQYVILNKAQQGEVTRENLKQTFRGNLQMSSDHFDHCITTLVNDGHLKEADGGKYTVTDDGREDVQKLHTIVMELPNVVQQGGGQMQRSGVTQQQSAGSRGSTTGTTGPTGGTTGGTTGGATGPTGGNEGGTKGQTGSQTGGPNREQNR